MSQLTPTPPTLASIEDLRATVHFESLALWKETDPQRRATIARQLALWMTRLADLETEAANRARHSSSNEAA